MKLLFFLCFCVLATCSFSQTDPISQAYGARSQSLGNQKINLKDHWSYFNQIGALDRISASGIAVTYNYRFGLKELSTASLAAGLKTDAGTFGFGLSRFGGDLFNQHLIGAGFSNTLGIMSFGAKVDWLQTQIEGFGSGNSFLISVGGMAELGPKTFFGANFSNINRGKFSKLSNQRVPTSIQMGISYVPSQSVALYSEVEKEPDSPAIVKMGMEYSPAVWLPLRVGISSSPARVSFGFGIHKNRFGFDYAFGENSILGSSHHLSLALQLQDL